MPELGLGLGADCRWRAREAAEDAAVAAARGRATSSPESTSRTSESLIERWYACSVDGGIADMGFFVGDSLPVPVLVGLKREERDASGAARAGRPSTSPPLRWPKRYGERPFFPRTVAVPSGESPNTRAAWSRSDTDSTWSQSSPTPSPRLVPLLDVVVAELSSSIDGAPVPGPSADGFAFCPIRKIDASEGRRGEDLCEETAGVVPYGELGWMSRRDATDSGPELVFPRRRESADCGRDDSRGRCRDESVLAETDDVDAGTCGSTTGCCCDDWDDCFFNERSISRMCRIPSRPARRFLDGERCVPGATPDSSLGSVTVLFIASPHRQLRLISSSGMSGCIDIVDDGSELFSISRSSKSCLWLRS